MGSMNLGRCFLIRNRLDSAMTLEKQADSIAQISLTRKYLANINTYFGDIARLKGERNVAYTHYRKGIFYGVFYQNYNGLVQAYNSMSNFFLEMKIPDSSLFYARESLKIIDSIGSSFSLIYVNKGAVYENVYKSYYLKKFPDSTKKYYIISLEQKDSISRVRIKTLTNFQNTLFLNQLRLQALEKEKIVSENRNRSRLFVTCIVLVVVVSFILFRSNRIKQRDNAILQNTLSNLRQAQAQLVQSEKMASLGELTAGIAHEIQNPLNFVNNFSEVSNELIDEMKAELDKGEVEEAKTIAADIQQNLSKIAHHGKRADSIVKGMLQHTRTSTGQKEPTDINALCDEYLRLSYHGLRAKDKSFNAAFESEFDESIGILQIVPQEIGRVLLNLLNNAFYAVNEKSRKGISDYTPKVLVKTKGIGQRVEITIEDNGMGIPDSIKEKIFQPFFTTKPTGQGTGLGLSLSYDIVKAHGGELLVQSQIGQGTSFFIQIPIN